MKHEVKIKRTLNGKYEVDLPPLELMRAGLHLAKGETITLYIRADGRGRLLLTRESTVEMTDEEIIEAISHRVGVDDPLIRQYYKQAESVQQQVSLDKLKEDIFVTHL